MFRQVEYTVSMKDHPIVTLVATFLLLPVGTFALTIAPIQATVVPTTTTAEITTGAGPGAGPALLEIDTIRGESPDSKAKGNVEYEWKVEEGEKAAIPSIEPDEIDVADDGRPITPDFGVLLGGETDDDATRAETEHDRDVFVTEAKVADSAIESIAFNYEKITAKVRHEVKLFGFIRVSTVADVDIDGDEKVSVHFPWWAVFATGKDIDGVGERTFTTLSNVLKTKHDTIKNSINNVR